MTVVRHLCRYYGPPFLVVFGALMIVLTGVVISYQVAEPYMLGHSIWQTATTQAVRWFVFVIAILVATLNLPVAIANGITRRDFYRGTIAFTFLITLAVLAIAMAGFGVEKAVFVANGVMAQTPANYPLRSLGNAISFLGESFLGIAGQMFAGLVIGLGFYRLRVIFGLMLIPVGLVLMGMAWPEPALALALQQRLGLAALGLAAGMAIGFALVRTAPMRQKKG